MSAFREIEEQEILKNKPDKIDPDIPPKDPNLPKEPKVLPPLQGLALEGYDKVKEMLDLSKEKKSRMDAKLRQMVEKKNIQLEQLSKLFMQRVHVNPTDFKRFLTLPSFVKTTLRVATLAQMQAMVSNAIIDKGIYLYDIDDDGDVVMVMVLMMTMMMMTITYFHFLFYRVGRDLPGLHQERYLVMPLLASLPDIPR